MKKVNNYKKDEGLKSLCSNCIYLKKENKCETCELYLHKQLSKKLGIIKQ